MIFIRIRFRKKQRKEDKERKFRKWRPSERQRERGRRETERNIYRNSYIQGQKHKKYRLREIGGFAEAVTQRERETEKHGNRKIPQTDEDREQA